MKKPSDPITLADAETVRSFVLAGARASGDALAQAHKVPSKAHIKIAGKSMISRVLDALTKSQRAGQVTVIGMQGYDTLRSKEAWPSTQFVDGADGPAASVYRMLSRDETDEPILVTTCDHALLTPAIIDRFVRESIASNADLTVALAKREDIEASYPGVSRTYLNFGDGAYSSCNLFCLLTPAASAVVQFWQSAEQDRKRPWRIAWRFGLVRGMRILIGRPSLNKVFEIISDRLNVNIRAVILPDAEAAIDVDSQQDLDLVEHVISERHA